MSPPRVFVTHYEVGVYRMTRQGDSESSSVSQIAAVSDLSSYYLPGPILSSLCSISLFDR